MMKQRNPETFSIFSFGDDFGFLNLEFRTRLKGGLTQGNSHVLALKIV